MTTDVFTLPRRALEGDDPTTPTIPQPPTETEQTAAPGRRPGRGIGHMLRVLFDDSRPMDSDPLFLLGPNGGPVWLSRFQ